MQQLSVAVSTQSHHSSDGPAAILDTARDLTIAVAGDMLLASTCTAPTET